MSIALVTSVFAQKKGAAKPAKSADAKVEMKSMMDSTSYTFGVNIGRSIQKDKIDIKLDCFFQGIKDAVGGSAIQLTDDQMQGLMQRFSQIMGEKQKEMAKVTSEKNKKDGSAFLEANKKKEGVVTTSSGLQYKILTKGTGKIPTAQDTVVAHYKGTLIDGTEFDNSFKRNEPATFAVTGVIKGWIEALQMMPVGSKWQIYVPADLAYGDQGAGQVIPPGATLIFEIELVSMK